MLRWLGILAVTIGVMALALLARTEPDASAGDCRSWVRTQIDEAIAASPSTEDQVTSWAGLELVATTGGVPSFSSTFVFQVPSDNRLVHDLLATPIATEDESPTGAIGNAYKNSLLRLLESDAVGLSSIAASSLIDMLGERPRITVSDG
ncbi:MAG: hypothetical protein IT336_03045, partial [Thermomicrobiales bacterium]|nr:hypothetical protein [Thermomicrobiales bacterium]